MKNSKWQKLIVGKAIILGITMFTGSAMATPISNTFLSGSDYQVFESDGIHDSSGGLTPVAVPNNAPGNFDPFLVGNSSAPGGNVELAPAMTLGQFSADVGVTTLTGILGGANTITLSSLVSSDWTTVLGSGQTLAAAYIADALASVGMTLPPLQLALVETSFLSSLAPWMLSDPNISYVNRNDINGAIAIGFAGFLDGSAIINDITGQMVPGAQASEVVKVNYQGTTSYLYDFSATDSLQDTGDDLIHSLSSHSGNYEVFVPVPEPMSLSLFGLGLAGLALWRRKK
jgi:hypothetical protein